MDVSSPNTSPYEHKFEPLLLIISGPSGVGKDAVVKRMAETGYPLSFVVTATDRPPRPGEVHGRDYYFYTTAEFERMIDRGEMLEYSDVYGQYKGVPRAAVRRALEPGVDVIMRLDVQGARKVKAQLPMAISVFLLPGSEEELLSRLNARKTESGEALQRRLETLREELTCIPEFDYVVMNRDNLLDEAVEDVKAILRAEHCRAVPPQKVCL